MIPPAKRTAADLEILSEINPCQEHFKSIVKTFVAVMRTLFTTQY